MTPERKVKAAVVKVLEAHGAYWFYPVQMGMGRAGIPDIIACHKGRFIGIECKAGRNTTTALQELELAKIARAGGMAIVVCDDKLSVLRSWLEV